MSDYSVNTLDQINTPAGYNLPDISTDAGNSYPADFAALMPGFVVPTVNSNSDGIGQVRGDWSTPQAYSWHSSDLLTTNPEIGGIAGTIDSIPFAMGQVESNTVENFEMLGEMATFQTPQVYNWGDVGYQNFSGVLGASVASGSYQELPFEVWSQNVIEGV
jgi:hypothetical protein